MTNDRHEQSTETPTAEAPKRARGMRLACRLGVDRFDVEPDDDKKGNEPEGEK